MTFSILIFWLITGFQTTSANPEAETNPEITSPSPVESVVLYLQGAHLTHRSTLEIPQGKHTVVFTGLNRELNSTSATVGFSGSVEIISVNHRTNRLRQSRNSDEIERLEKEKEILEHQIRSVQIDQEVIGYETEMLSLNREPEGQSGASLSVLLALHRERIRELKTQTAILTDSLQSLNNNLNEINRKLQQPEFRPYITEGELVVEVNNPSNGTYEAEISYPIRSAGWLPEYELRAHGTEVPVAGRLYAAVTNNSLQTWEDIDLTLSTRTPQRGTDTPVLEPWFLDFFSGGFSIRGRSLNPNSSNEITGTVIDAITGEPLTGAVVRISDKNVGTSVDRSGSYTLIAPAGSSEIQVNFIGYKSITVPITNSIMDFRMEQDVTMLQEVVVLGYARSADQMAASPPPQSSRAESMLARQFELRDKQTLPSSGEPNRITLEEYSIPARFSYLTVPKIQEGAILKTNIEDWEEYFLLPGIASLHLEGTFTGQTYINPQTVSDTLEVSFGRDSGIVVSREKVGERSERSFFRNRVTQTMTHEITVRNTKGYPIEIEVLDQIPVSARDQIEVNATELNGGELNDETGIVSWNQLIPPSGSVILELAYQVRYPSGESIRLE